MTKAELEEQLATSQKRYEDTLILLEAETAKFEAVQKLLALADGRVITLVRQCGSLCNFFRYYFESHTIMLPSIDGEGEQVLNCSVEGLDDDHVAALADNLYTIMLNTHNILGMLY